MKRVILFVGKALLYGGITLFSLLLFFVLFIVVRAALKPPLTAEVRKEIGGTYQQLSRGVTHYEYVKVSDSAPVVLLLHGITVPMIVWDKTAPALNKAGISTVRFDYYGRGYSDRPKVAYGSGLFANQALELLDSLGINKPVHIMGVSLGGAITAQITAQHENKIASATLIDPAVAFAREKTWREKSSYMLKRLKKIYTALTSGDDTNGNQPPSESEVYRPYIREQFKYKGMEFTYLSMLKHGDVNKFLNSYYRLGKQPDIPIQIIWGEKDKLLPVALGYQLQGIIPHATLHVIPDGGHTPQYGKPELVNPILIHFVATIEHQKVQERRVAVE